MSRSLQLSLTVSATNPSPEEVALLKAIIEMTERSSAIRLDDVSRQNIGSCLPDGPKMLYGIREARLRAKQAEDERRRTSAVAALRAHDWNITHAAEQLHISDSTLWRWIRLYGIRREPARALATATA